VLDVREHVAAPCRKGGLQVQAAQAGLTAGVEQVVLRCQVGLSPGDLVGFGKNDDQSSDIALVGEPAKVVEGVLDPLPEHRIRVSIERRCWLCTTRSYVVFYHAAVYLRFSKEWGLPCSSRRRICRSTSLPGFHASAG
jgi:hypothetical protein